MLAALAVSPVIIDKEPTQCTVSHSELVLSPDRLDAVSVQMFGGAHCFSLTVSVLLWWVGLVKTRTR